MGKEGRRSGERGNLDEFALGVFAAALFRDVDHAALHQLEQGLLHPLPTHVPRDADALALLGHLVYLPKPAHRSCPFSQLIVHFESDLMAAGDVSLHTGTFSMILRTGTSFFILSACQDCRLLVKI
jgi:hypothetical protein